MPMIVTDGSDIKAIKVYLKRVNKTNDIDLAWRWYADGMIEVYWREDERPFVVTVPRMVIKSMQLQLNDKGLTDPDA